MQRVLQYDKLITEEGDEGIRFLVLYPHPVMIYPVSTNCPGQGQELYFDDPSRSLPTQDILVKPTL